MSIIDPNAQEGALKCEIRACHFVRFRKNMSKRNVKKNNEGTLESSSRNPEKFLREFQKTKPKFHKNSPFLQKLSIVKKF